MITLYGLPHGSLSIDVDQPQSFYQHWLITDFITIFSFYFAVELSTSCWSSQPLVLLPYFVALLPKFCYFSAPPIDWESIVMSEERVSYQYSRLCSRQCCQLFFHRSWWDKKFPHLVALYFLGWHHRILLWDCLSGWIPLNGLMVATRKIRI